MLTLFQHRQPSLRLVAGVVLASAGEQFDGSLFVVQDHFKSAVGPPQHAAAHSVDPKGDRGETHEMSVTRCAKHASTADCGLAPCLDEVEFCLELRQPLELDVLVVQNALQEFAAFVQQRDQAIEFSAGNSGTRRARNARHTFHLRGLWPWPSDSHEWDAPV
jgi:hypothetical protein